jgi:5-(aminomethyl)-3-furanmethanol phosphate kinase
MPYSALREQFDELTSWEVSADSLALRLARRLNAERLVVVKSCAVDPTLGVAELCRRGVLDVRFSDWSCTADFQIDVVDEGALPEVRRRLIGHETQLGAGE